MPVLLSGLAIVLTIVNILACLWLIRWSNRSAPADVAESDTMGHKWDGDLEELNNPLPRWWLFMFYLSIGFGLIYLILYPGLGHLAGTKGWSQVGQYEAEVAAAESRYAAYFARFHGMDLTELTSEPDAVATGRRVFANHCTTCHGADGRGARGFPNLADSDWLYGGAPETVLATILNGRNGIMPPMGAALGGDSAVDAMVQYVKQLGTPGADAAPESTRTQFATLCAACHTAAGTGMQALGAPNLTDDIWLHGGGDADIRATIVNGLNNPMPAHRELLSEDKARLAAAYVLSLTAEGGAGGR